MNFELQFSDKEITPWGGMALIPHPAQSQRGWNHDAPVRKFDQATHERVFGAWYAGLFSQLRIGGLTLDLDSTVMTRYGTQEGTAMG